MSDEIPTVVTPTPPRIFRLGERVEFDSPSGRHYGEVLDVLPNLGPDKNHPAYHIQVRGHGTFTVHADLVFAPGSREE
jgi:hypothetical protein